VSELEGVPELAESADMSAAKKTMEEAVEHMNAEC
jgi:hypothetical protein